jgi:hypothetical protein
MAAGIARVEVENPQPALDVPGRCPVDGLRARTEGGWPASANPKGPGYRPLPPPWPSGAFPNALGALCRGIEFGDSVNVFFYETEANKCLVATAVSNKAHNGSSHYNLLNQHTTETHLSH